MRRRRSFILLCSSSTLSVATGPLCLSFVTPAEPARRPQSAAPSALVTALGTGGSSSLCFRAFRFSFALTVFVCSRSDSGIISHDSGAFAVAAPASLPAACVPYLCGSGRIPESGAGSSSASVRHAPVREQGRSRGVSPVCKDQHGPSGRAPVLPIAAKPFSVLLFESQVCMPLMTSHLRRARLRVSDGAPEALSPAIP